MAPGPLPPSPTSDTLTFTPSSAAFSSIAAPSAYTPVTEPTTISGSWEITEQRLHIQYERVVTQNTLNYPVDNSGISLSGCNWDGIFGSGVVATPYETALQCRAVMEITTRKVDGNWSSTIEVPQLLQVQAVSADYKGQGYGTYPTGYFLGARGYIRTTQPYLRRRPWKTWMVVSGHYCAGNNYLVVPDPAALRGQGNSPGHLRPGDMWSNQLRSSCVGTQNADLSWGPGTTWPFGNWYLFKPDIFPLQGRYDIALENDIVSQGGEPWIDLISDICSKATNYVLSESDEFPGTWDRPQATIDNQNAQGNFLWAENAQDTYISYGGLAGWQPGDIPSCIGYSDHRHDYTGLFN